MATAAPCLALSYANFGGGSGGKNSIYEKQVVIFVHWLTNKKDGERWGREREKQERKYL